MYQNSITEKVHALIPTPLGSMIAIGNGTHLYYLNFVDAKNVANECAKIGVKYDAHMQSNSGLQSCRSISLVVAELNAYFAGTLTRFTVPLHQAGSEFQLHVWRELALIPYGHTRSYQQQAGIVGKPSAYRAVANANAANRFAIIVPCHRVIGSDGKLAGYAGGVDRKKWLIEHEKSVIQREKVF